MTVPGARAVIVKSITDLERLRISVGSGPLFAVMSREKAKLSYRWMPAVIQRWATSKGRLLRDEETGEPFRVPCCPDCTAQIVDKDGVPLTDEDLNRRKHTCAGCGAPLWQADQSGPARYPLADYVKHRMKGFFDLLIGDEVHNSERPHQTLDYRTPAQVFEEGRNQVHQPEVSLTPELVPA